jgi:hypothetical protein
LTMSTGREVSDVDADRTVPGCHGTAKELVLLFKPFYSV